MKSAASVFASVFTCLLFGFALNCPAQEPVAFSVLEVAPVVDDGGEAAASRERVLAFKVALNQLAEGKKFRLLQALKLRRAANDDAICEYLALKYQEQLDEVAAQAVAGDQFMKWIEWVIQNQESIIKFVTTLIDLFGGKTSDLTDHLVAGPLTKAWQLQKATRARVRSFEHRVLARLS